MIVSECPLSVKWLSKFAYTGNFRFPPGFDVSMHIHHSKRQGSLFLVLVGTMFSTDSSKPEFQFHFRAFRIDCSWRTLAVRVTRK